MISTGIALGPPIPYAPGFENGSYNVLFDASSDSLVSHIITVDENPFVVEAFGLVAPEVVQIWTVGGYGSGQYFSQLYINGQIAQLTSTNNKISLDVSGRYQFRLTGGLGTVYVAGHDANVASSLVGLGQYVI